MEIYRVSFIGHREVDNFSFVEEQVENIVKELIETKEYVEFYVGRNGEFDIMVASVIKRAQKGYGNENSSLILVITYPIADIEDLENYYDEILYPQELKGVHFKSAITKRNEWFLDNSELLVAYVERDYGGAYECLKKAKQKRVTVNLIKSDQSP